EEQVVMYAHSLILQARSNYFARALNSEWKEANQGIIRKPNISPTVFERILQYIYGGRLMVDDEMVTDLIKAADELCMEDLLQGCERHALTTICRSNVLDMMQLASQHNLAQLKRECLDFIASNIDYLKRGKSILTLDSDVLKDILSLDQLDLDELEIWKIAVRWTYYQQDLDWEKCSLLDFPKGSGCVVVQVTSNDGTKDSCQDEDNVQDYASDDDEYADARVPLRGTTVHLGKPNDVDEDIFRQTTHSVFKPVTTHNVIQMSSSMHEDLRRQIAPVLSAIRFMRIPSVDFLRLIEGTGLLPVQLCTKATISQPKLILQYRATRDGFDATNFHIACDQRGPTLTIVRTDNGMIFGGYNGSSWSRHPTGVYSTSRSNFLFTLKNREHPTRENAVFGIKGDGSAAAYSKADYGPTFGVGHDLYISSNCNLSCLSSSTMPSTYNGIGASSTALAGSSNFRVQEYEVFLVN
ncbi:hypothetical protein BGZ65_009345, partial [Modicella reniformis]